MAKENVTPTTEIIESVKERGVTKFKIGDNGEMDLSTIPQDKLTYYKEISKSLNEKDLSSVMSYGADLQEAMGSYSNDFLKQTFSSNSSIESARLVSRLLNKLKEVDVDELKAPTKLKSVINRIPLLNKLIYSVDKIKTKYQAIQTNIDGIISELETARQIAIRDNNLLQNQFEGNVDYIDQVTDLIVAGKLKIQELDSEIGTMKANPDQYESYELSDIQEYKGYLEKRINDLLLLRFAFKKSLMDIRIIQRTNILSANNTEQHIKMTIPFWKNQLSVAVALYDQKKIIDMNSMMSNATNEMLTKNSQMIKTQSVEAIKQNTRSILDIESLRKATQDLIETVEGIRKVQEESTQKQINAENELRQLEETMTKTICGMKAIPSHVVSRELETVESR